MEKHKQYYPVTVLDRSEDLWPERDHSHNYFEIIYIQKGKGIHYLNDVEIFYKAGAVFVLNPEDHHHFDIHEHTRFISIRFTDSFIDTCIGIPPELGKNMLQMLKNDEIRNSRLQFHRKNKEAIESLFTTVLCFEHDENVIYYQVLSILHILQKNLVLLHDVHGIHTETPKIDQLLSYIHSHITRPQMLHIDRLSRHFSISRNYVSNYFKRNMGVTLKQYIDHYRMGLIQNRLTHSSFTIKEIAYDFGFTDESHLNKTFKKYWGVSAKAYRHQKEKDGEYAL